VCGLKLPQDPQQLQALADDLQKKKINEVAGVVIHHVGEAAKKMLRAEQMGSSRQSSSAAEMAAKKRLDDAKRAYEEAQNDYSAATDVFRIAQNNEEAANTAKPQWQSMDQWMAGQFANGQA
jgi:hypothetical protein